MSLFKTLFSRNNSDAGNDDEHSIEWRNRYLSARLEYLKKKIEKKGVHVGSIETSSSDIEAINKFLTEKVEALEIQLKAL